jgi:hypothetical protein
VFCPMGTSTPLLVRTLRRTGTGVPPVSDETEETGGTPVPLFQALNQDGLPCGSAPQPRNQSETPFDSAA